MRKIIALTDVLAHENRFPKGTGFHVVDRPDPKAKPVQIDPRTAAVWSDSGWCEDVPGKAKTDAG